MALTLLIDFQSCKAFHNWNIFGKLIRNDWKLFDKILVFNPVLLNSIGIKQLFPFLLKSTVSLYDLVLADCCNCWSGFINSKKCTSTNCTSMMLIPISMNNNAIQGLLWWKSGCAYWDIGIWIAYLHYHRLSVGRSCQEGSSSRTCSRRPGFTDRVKAWDQDRPHTGATE